LCIAGLDEVARVAQRIGITRRLTHPHMLHPHTELRLISERCGYGVVATRFIPRGTVVWVRCGLDQTLPAHRVAGFQGPYRTAASHYCYVDRRGDFVLCWDHARFVNHSCEPNCISPGLELDLAVRDIAPGEQLTNHYGALNLDHRFHCECGAPSCQGEIRGLDVHDRVPSWDALLWSAARDVERVEQPLWDILQDADSQALIAAARGLAALPTSGWHLVSSEPVVAPRPEVRPRDAG
jgi:hypothetical protein